MKNTNTTARFARLRRAAAMILVLALALALTACGGKKNEAASEGDTMALSDMMAKILDGASDLPATGDIAIDRDNYEFYLFTPYIEGSEALASDALIGSIAHSVVLLRTPDGVDAAKTAADIEKNANPRKWICVEAEKTEVVYHGSTILLVMSAENTAKDIVAAFNGLWS